MTIQSPLCFSFISTSWTGPLAPWVKSNLPLLQQITLLETVQCLGVERIDVQEMTTIRVVGAMGDRKRKIRGIEDRRRLACHVCLHSGLGLLASGFYIELIHSIYRLVQARVSVDVANVTVIENK